MVVRVIWYSQSFDADSLSFQIWSALVIHQFKVKSQSTQSMTTCLSRFVIWGRSALNPPGLELYPSRSWTSKNIRLCSLYLELYTLTHRTTSAAKRDSNSITRRTMPYNSRHHFPHIKVRKTSQSNKSKTISDLKQWTPDLKSASKMTWFKTYFLCTWSKHLPIWILHVNHSRMQDRLNVNANTLMQLNFCTVCSSVQQESCRRQLRLRAEIFIQCIPTSVHISSSLMLYVIFHTHLTLLLDSVWIIFGLYGLETSYFFVSHL